MNVDLTNNSMQPLEAQGDPGPLPPLLPADELTLAKCELARLADEHRWRPLSMVTRRPMAVATAALVGVAVLTRFPAARRAALATLLWVIRSGVRGVAWGVRR